MAVMVRRGMLGRTAVICALGAVMLGAVLVLFLNHKHPGSEPSRIQRRIPAEYFGLTINGIGRRLPWPDVEFSGVRLWGAIYWAEINPAPGIYNWTRFDAILVAAERHHVDVVFNLAFTPRWAASVPDAAPAFSPGASSAPADIKHWEDFITAALQRAAGRIRYWEIWNEPEDPKYYSGDIATMVRLQRRAFEIIKASDPSLQVITPSFIGTAEGFRWQSDFLAAGGGKYADIIGFHGYWDDPKPEALIPIIVRIKTLLAAHGLADKPLWDTESGWPASLNDQDLQSAFVARSYLLRWSFGIDRFYWYAYEGGGANFGKLWDPKLGLLRPGQAYRTIQRWLVGAAPSGPIERNGRVWTLKLDLKDGRSALAVWMPEGTSSFASGSDYDRYETLDGDNHVVVNDAVEIGPKPVLLIAKAR